MTLVEQLEAKAKELTTKFCTNNEGFKWNERLYAQVMVALTDGAKIAIDYTQQMERDLASSLQRK